MNFERKDSSYVLPLCVIIALAVILRFYEVNNNLWFDEIWTLIETVRLPFIELITSYKSNNNHPLYSLLSHLMITVLGESSFSFRLISALAGVVSVAVIYLLSREFGSRREALAAALLLATSYHHVFHSQQARGYTLLLVLLTLSTLFLYRAITAKERNTKNFTRIIHKGCRAA